MHRLSPLDEVYTAADSEHTPMHGGELQIYRLPDGLSEQTWLTNAEARLRSIARHLPFMNHRLHRDPLNLGPPVWVSAAVDLEAHIRHVQLPPPGDAQALEACVARIYETRLAPGKPLWQHTFITGLEGNRTALLFKGSHAYADAQMQQEVHALLNDGGPQAEALPLPERLPIPSSRRLLADTLTRARTSASEAAAKLPEMLAASTARTWGPVTPASFNKPVDGNRAITLVRLPIAPLTQLARQEGCKLNDVFLALVSGALGARESTPLQGLCSVALPTTSRLEKATNATASIRVDLASTVADPLQRLRLIAEHSTEAKSQVRGLGALAGWNPEVPGLSAALTAVLRIGERTRLDRQMRWPFHVVLSNVRGPVEAPTLAGAALEASYFLSMLFHGLGLAVACFSVGTHLNISITSCPRAAPSQSALREGFADAYEALAGCVRTRTSEPR